VACYAYTKKTDNCLFTYRKQFDEERDDFDKLDYLHGVSDASGNIEFFLVASCHAVREVNLERAVRDDEKGLERSRVLIIEELAAPFLIHQPRKEHAILLHRKHLLVT